MYRHWQLTSSGAEPNSDRLFIPIIKLNQGLELGVGGNTHTPQTYITDARTWLQYKEFLPRTTFSDYRTK